MLHHSSPQTSKQSLLQLRPISFYALLQLVQSELLRYKNVKATRIYVSGIKVLLTAIK